MNFWAAHVIVQSGLLASAAVSLSMHTRLVRFFDLTWALWAMMSTFAAVRTTAETGSPLIGVLAGAACGMVLGAVENGLALTRFLTSYIPRETLERFTFTGALGLYLCVTSVLGVAGFRSLEMVPGTGSGVLGLTPAQVATTLGCWGLVLLSIALRLTSGGRRISAMLDDPAVAELYGLSSRRLATTIGALAGALAGAAGGSFGVLYFAHPSAGFNLMLMAVIPCILAGRRTSVGVVGAAVVFSAAVAVVQFAIGFPLAALATNGLLVVLMLTWPDVISGRAVRTV